MKTFHLHHSGRALYTLIQPSTGKASPPVVHRVLMGSDLEKGEVTQLFVPGGWWKASEIPAEDLRLLQGSEAHALRERIGCLISEVVVPGWTVSQHQFLTEDKVGCLLAQVLRYGTCVLTTSQLRALWGGTEGWQAYTVYLHGAPTQ